MNGQLFRLLALLLALAAFTKVFFGVFFHHRFYEWARRQYAQSQRPWTVNLLLIYALGMLVLVWVATLTAYVPRGWILTAFITLASVKSLGLMLRWEETSRRFCELIDRAGPKLWFVDLLVALLGAGFLLLGLLVY